MAYPSITKRMLAFGAALLLVLTLIGSTTLATHHQHEHDHDEAYCTVCQLIQASIARLRSTNSLPMSAWGIFMAFLSLVLILCPSNLTLVHTSLVKEKIRCNN